jgi:signal transduction histidine kinase/CheY-like chemotaxis protein
MVISLFIILGSIIIEFLIRRQRAEKERKEAHETILTILNSIDATIYVSDLDTHKILFMNQRMIDSFGGDFTGHICHNVFQHSSTVCSQCRKEKLVDESGNPLGVVMWEDKNPVNGVWYANYDRAIKWIDGRTVHLQIATDITKIKELQQKQIIAESKLRQSQKMESIGNLAGGIAHDFNNILSSIIGFTELALDSVDKNTLINDNLQEVYTAGLRAKDLVKQILAFARQSEEERKPIQPGLIIQEVLQFLRSTIPTTIKIQHVIESDSLVMGNATQVHQMMMNLCTNAAHAMEDAGGTLEVTISDVTKDHITSLNPVDLAHDDYVEIKVSDTGAGIAPDVIDSIFEPYFTTKAPGEGTGMGLAVVQGIVETYGGQIKVNSTLGEGTSFLIYLPITRKRGQLEIYRDSSMPIGREHILFVDDEAPLTRMGEQVLSHLGYSVTTRTSSVEAIELFKSRPKDFDLVISDMTMPNITGDQLAIELMQIRKDIPIILCTGFSRKISDEKASRLGVKAIIYKPIVMSDLAKTIRKVLDEADATV